MKQRSSFFLLFFLNIHLEFILKKKINILSQSHNIYTKKLIMVSLSTFFLLYIFSNINGDRKINEVIEFILLQ